MEEKYLLFVDKVFVDLLYKSNCNKSIFKTSKLITRLIKSNHIKDSTVLIRSLYEEILGELSIISDPSFIIDVKTQPREIRKKVINNINTLFEENTVDENILNELYDYLSNISHESTTRRLMIDLINDKEDKYIMKCNSYHIFNCIMYIYLNYLYKSKKEADFINKLFVSGISMFFNALYQFTINKGKEHFDKYKGYFITERDINFIDKKKQELQNLGNDLNNNLINPDDISNYFSDLESLIKEFGYKKLYDKINLDK